MSRPCLLNGPLMKINEAFLSRLRELKRNAGEATLPGNRAPLGRVNLPKFGGDLPAMPPLPAFVNDLLDQLGVSKKADINLREPGPPERTAEAGRPGQFVTRSFGCAAGVREYKLFIPSAYTGKPLPLVMMLHGCTQGPDDFAAGTRANMIAEEFNCFVAYPAQTANANNSKCWNWFEPGHQRAEGGEPAILAGIAREIMTTYAVDDARVFVAGLSAGGAMAAILAATYPTVFAAAGVHSGLPVGVAHDLPSALGAMRDGGRRSGKGVTAAPVHPLPPMIIFQGDEDKTVHPRNAEAIACQCIAGRVSQTIEETGQAMNGRRFTRRLVLDSGGEAIVEMWLIHHAGHAWAGGDTTGSYTDPKGPDATREMFKFFFAHPQRRAKPVHGIDRSSAFLRG